MDFAQAGLTIATLSTSAVGGTATLWALTRAARNDARRARSELVREQRRSDALLQFIYHQRQHQVAHNLNMHGDDPDGIALLPLPKEVDLEDKSEPEGKLVG